MTWPVVVFIMVAPCFQPVTDIDHHDHTPFWTRAILLGGFIASGGDL